MGLNHKYIVAGLLAIFFNSMATAEWQNAMEVISGTWGANNDQFGIEYGDTNDTFAGPFYILADGGIIIRDVINGRRKIYDHSGVLKKVTKCIKSQIGEWNEECRITGDYVQINADGNIWVDQSKYQQSKYTLYSPSGQLITTSTTRPPELGIAEGGSATSGGYLQRVKYPDKTFSFVIPWKTLKSYQRDNTGNLIVTAWTDAKDVVYKISVCGKILGQLQMPEDKGHIVQQAGPETIGELDYEFGSPVIAPNGDVYTWKRTPDKYSILKWTWVDDPNTPGGPDAPTGLTVMPSTTGLYLTWTASPQDPGCVTGYEVSRATSAGGIGTTIATVDKGVVKYNDTTASAGTMYYYKVRAKAGSEYSNYTNEVSGKR